MFRRLATTILILFFPFICAAQIFPGCEDLPSGKELKKCSDTKMLQYIYAKLKYPPETKEKGIEGTAVVQFTVEKNGEICNPRLLRDPGHGMGQQCKGTIYPSSQILLG